MAFQIACHTRLKICRYLPKLKDCRGIQRIRQLNKEWRLRNREYDLNRKQEYRIKNKELIKAKDKLRLLNNPEGIRQRQNKWRRDNRAIMRTYGMIQHYRTKQKALALQYLKNDTYSPSIAKDPSI